MSWVKLDDHFPEHEKVHGLHDRAFRFHVTALCYCARNLTDGNVDARAAGVIAAVLGVQAKRWLQELVEAGLWAKSDDGWTINDYTEYNPSSAQVKEGRSAAAERMRVHRASRGSTEHAGERTNERAGERSGTPSRPLSFSSKALPTTWQPALGIRNPVQAIEREIKSGIHDLVSLEAEFSANPSLTDTERDELRALLEAA